MKKDDHRPILGGRSAAAGIAWTCDKPTRMRSKPVARRLAAQGSSHDELDVQDTDTESSSMVPPVMVPPCLDDTVNSTINNNSTMKYSNTSLTTEYENLRLRSADQLLGPENLHKVQQRSGKAEEHLNGNGGDGSSARLRTREAGLIPDELEMRSCGGIWTRRTVPRGTKYGPFQGKWAGEPVDSRYAWEVVAGSGGRGWLDGSLDTQNWLKYINSSGTQPTNVQHFLQCGQLWYETNVDVNAGVELILGPREPLQLQDMFGDSTTSDDRSDRETASQHSGTVEDEREDIDEEDNESRCCVCEKVFNEVDQLDEHLVISHRYPRDQYRCDLCPRAYSHRPCLIRHRAIVHGDLRKYPCENCPKVFTDPSNLQRHIRSHHVGARSHACPECGKTFATSSGLKQHTHIHSSVKPFQCEVCFKAYTQFSNLCRHKRMHADCRMQIKCVKCSQSFSTVTSLSKHKRFCDSTTPSQSLNPPPPMPLGNLNPMANNAPNPFLMYRGPSGLPFFPPHFTYPPIFHPSGHPTPFFNNALLFNQLPKLHEDSSASPTKRVRSSSPERASPSVKERLTPPRVNPVGAKVSPPTAEEASSHLAPSPARPPASANIFNNPREQLLAKHDASSEDEEATHPRDFTRAQLVVEDKVARSKSVSSDDVETPSEQPLDLSVSRKRPTTTSAAAPAAPLKTVVTPPPPQRSPTKRHDKKDECESIQRIDGPQSPYEKINVTPPPMAYPRPIHPSMLMEPLYRNAFPGLTGGDRLLPPSPFGPPRTFPYLGPLGQQRPNFDLLRPGAIPGFGNMKPFQDVINQHSVNNKMKDRYACKFCGKVFPRSANLTRHLRTHTGEQPYKCKYCERSFSISSNLQRHVRNIHNKEKPFKCPLCERCFGQQTNLDRHLKKHEADDGSGGVAVADSPGSSNENEREDAYFDEIRSFMGKVTYSGSEAYNQTHLYTPSHLRDVIDVVGKDDDDSEGFSEDHHSPTIDDAIVGSKRDGTTTTTSYDVVKIKQEKDDVLMINNNDQTLKVST